MKIMLRTILILLACGEISMAAPDRRPMVEDGFLNSHAVMIQNMRYEDDLLEQSEPGCRSCFFNFINSITNFCSRFIDSCLEPASSVPVEQQRMFHFPPY